MVIRFSKILIFLLLVKLKTQAQENSYTPGSLSNYINGLMAQVEDPAKQAGIMDPNTLANLPVGLAKQIGGHTFIIAIDSASFYPHGAYFNAYTAFDFPGTSQKVAFAAKNIKFNPKGVVGGEQSKLVLVSDHLIQLGPKTQLYLPNDGNNYVEWNCNGLQAVHLKGEFRFSKGMIVPDSGSTQDYVTATFEIHANDIYNVVAQVNISPFRIQGLKDFSFTVSNAVVDMSDMANSPAMVFPANYVNTYGDNVNLWRGFYIQNFTVKLPEQLQSTSGSPLTVSATHMLIDDAGISGIFSVNNPLAMGEGNMSGWDFSVTQLGVTLVCNNLSSGTLAGAIRVEPLDNNIFQYTANISKNESTGKADFLFTVQPKSNINMSGYYAKVDIYSSSVLTVAVQNGKFRPKFKLNGVAKIGHDNLKLPSLSFQNLTLVTHAPYITDGIFCLSSPQENLLGKFPITIDNITLGTYNQVPTIGLEVGLNLSDGTSGFSVETFVKIVPKIISSPVNYTLTGASQQPVHTNWEFDKIIINDIHLQVNTQPFKLDGILSFYDAHPTYGKGFKGSLTMEFPDILPAPMAVSCAFGRTTFKYWSVDVAVPLNLPIPGTPLMITQLRGGMSQHMGSTMSTESFLDAVATNASTSSGLSGQSFVPNESIGLNFRAGIGVDFAKNPSMFNADVILSVTFNSTGSLNNIVLAGNAYMLAKRNERNSASNRIRGGITVSFDNQEDIFSVNAGLDIAIQSALYGSASSKLYISPDKWYFWLGRPTAPCYVNLVNIASVNAYFMMGQELEPMPPPPSQLLSLINSNHLDEQRNMTAITGGNGIAVGVNFSRTFEKEFGWDAFEIYGSGGVVAGFDVTMYKYGPNARCEGSTVPGVGIKNWYLNGQLYAWVGINAGIRGHLIVDFDITLLQTNVAILVQGKLPKPTWAAGYVHIDVTVLEFIHADLDFAVEFGNYCNVING